MWIPGSINAKKFIHAVCGKISKYGMDFFGRIPYNIRSMFANTDYSVIAGVNASLKSAPCGHNQTSQRPEAVH